ncbi:hypothetical protein DFAR_480002 [Desulfarculales bacterium]
MVEAIHRHSKRAEGSFVVVSCSAYPETLLSSEFFSHDKGPFTGAIRRKVGRFELAHGGTYWPMAAPNLWVRWPRSAR